MGAGREGGDGLAGAVTCLDIVGARIGGAGTGTVLSFFGPLPVSRRRKEENELDFPDLALGTGLGRSGMFLAWIVGTGGTSLSGGGL